MERRTLIRLLVGLGIGLPVAIELATFGGLFESRVLDGDGGDGADGDRPRTPTADGTGTPPEGAVGVGDELLPATEQADTVTGAEVRTEGGKRVFVMTVAVENDTEAGYELRLDALSTRSGTTVTGGGRSEQIEPGGSATVTGRWELPAGERPDSVIVVATLTAEDGGRETATRRVPLAVE